MHTIIGILIEISVKIRMAKRNDGSYFSCVTNSEFYFRNLPFTQKILARIVDLNPYNHKQSCQKHQFCFALIQLYSDQHAGIFQNRTWQQQLCVSRVLPA